MASHLSTVLLGTTHVERGRILVWPAIRAGAVIGALMTVAVATGHAKDAVPLAVGAILVALAEAGESVGRRWRTMLWVTLWLMLATLAAVLLSDFRIAVVIASAALALVCGVAGVGGPRAALAGVLVLVDFTVFVGAPQLPDAALGNALLIGLGGITVTALTVVPHIIRAPRTVIPSGDSVTNLWARIRPRLTWSEPFVRHGVRLAVGIALATAIAQWSGLAHAYWLPMTIAWVTKPDAEGTVSKVAARTLGTFVGLAVCALAVLVLGITGYPAILVCALAAGLTVAFVTANYAVAVASITVMVVLVFSIEGDPIDEAIDVRLGATILAAAMAIAGSYIWRQPPPAAG